MIELTPQERQALLVVRETWDREDDAEVVVLANALERLHPELAEIKPFSLRELPAKWLSMAARPHGTIWHKCASELEAVLGDLPDPIDITQLPAYIELQKRLALAEAERDAALRKSDEWMGRCHISDVDGMRWHDRAKRAEAKLEAVFEWGEKYALPQDGKDELDAILDDQ